MYKIEQFKYVEGLDKTLMVSSFGRFIAIKSVNNYNQFQGSKKVNGKKIPLRSGEDKKVIQIGESI